MSTYPLFAILGSSREQSFQKNLEPPRLLERSNGRYFVPGMGTEID